MLSQKGQGTKEVESSLETNYVYDDLGLLRVVIQPERMADLADLTTNYQDFTKQWCFLYTYDERRRMVSKQVLLKG